MTFYHNMITGFGEEGPFIFVGWGGGGEIVYEYAVDHPEIVRRLPRAPGEESERVIDSRSVGVGYRILGCLWIRS